MVAMVPAHHLPVTPCCEGPKEGPAMRGFGNEGVESPSTRYVVHCLRGDQLRNCYPPKGEEGVSLACIWCIMALLVANEVYEQWRQPWCLFW